MNPKDLRTHRGIIAKLREYESGIPVKSSEEKAEDFADKCVCECGNDSFRVYITTIIDDARLYCNKCCKEWL